MLFMSSSSSMRGNLHRLRLHLSDPSNANGLPAVRATAGQAVLSAMVSFENLGDFVSHKDQLKHGDRKEAHGSGGREGSGVGDSSDDGSAFEQAAGHKGSFTGRDGFLEKRVGARERQFYEDAEQGAWPSVFLPRYGGRAGGRYDRAGQAGNGHEGSILVEDLTWGMERPCVMDLKIGVSSVEGAEKSFMKKAKMTALDLLTGTKISGVRLEGMSMYRVLEGKKVRGSKIQSHMSASMGASLQDVITFFLVDESGIRTDLALRFQKVIENLLVHFQHSNDKYKFIGSSLLFVYDNDNRAPHMRWARALTRARGSPLSEDDVRALTRRTKMAVRMIDFAHTSTLPKDEKRDYGYIQGLQSILVALKEIRKSREAPIFSFRSAVVDACNRKYSVDTNEFLRNCDFNSLLSELSLSGQESEEDESSGGDTGNLRLSKVGVHT